LVSLSEREGVAPVWAANAVRFRGLAIAPGPEVRAQTVLKYMAESTALLPPTKAVTGSGGCCECCERCGQRS
jgi:hypothetical protein